VPDGGQDRIDRDVVDARRLQDGMTRTPGTPLNDFVVAI
jgi:hypothetical protein